MFGLETLQCPDYTLLYKCINQLDFKMQKFKKDEKADDDIVSIAIDSTGLKRFGKDEWYQEKHNVSAKRSWRKHI